MTSSRMTSRATPNPTGSTNITPCTCSREMTRGPGGVGGQVALGNHLSVIWESRPLD